MIWSALVALMGSLRQCRLKARQKVIENHAWNVYIIFKIRLGNIGNVSILAMGNGRNIPESDSKSMENRRVLICWQQ